LFQKTQKSFLESSKFFLLENFNNSQLLTEKIEVILSAKSAIAHGHERRS
jgi:hypothetical protein